MFFLGEAKSFPFCPVKSVHVVTTSAGPDSGAAFRVASPLTVGSGTQQDGVVDDVALDAHHFVVAVDGPVAPLQEIATAVVSDDELIVEAGTSQFRISGESNASIWPTPRAESTPVVRPRRQITTEPVIEVTDVPDPPQQPRATTFLMPVVSIATSVVIAVVARSWMFLLFGATAAVMGITSGLSELVRYRREKKQHVDTAAGIERSHAIQHAAVLEFEREQSRMRWPLDVDSMLRSNRLWEARPDHEDFLSCVVGVNPLRSSEGRDGDPVFVQLLEHRILVVQAWRPIGESIVRQLLSQICLRSGPADISLDVSGLCDIPVAYARNLIDDSRHHIKVTDDIESLSRASSGLRQQVLDNDRITIVALADRHEQVPSCAAVLIRTEDDWKGELITDAGTTLVHSAGVSAKRWQSWSTELSALTDPECRDHSVAAIPVVVSLGEVPRQADNSLRVDIGESINGSFELDLVRDGPHMLVAGTTGSGKSEFLRTLITSLCLKYSSTALHLILIDFKGGSTFDEFTALPHVAGVISDLDGELIDRMLGGLQVEIQRREHVLREAHARDISDLVAKGHSLARLVVIVDEFAVLSHRYPERMKTFTAIAAQGRSLGLHLVLASQRVSGVVTDDVQANTDLRIAFRVANAAESRDVIGCPEAAAINKAHPGRAFITASGSEAVEVQTAVVANDDIITLNRLCARLNDPPARRPWSDPLPVHLPPSGDGLGLIDLPEQQSHKPWTWSPRDGRLSIEGNLGSGTTTALISMLHHNSNSAAYVIDARGDEALLCINDFSNVAPVVFAWDEERRGRLLKVLAAELETRKKCSSADQLIVAVDGVSEFIRQLDDRELEVFRALLREGDGVGICVVTAGGEPPVPAGWRVVLGGDQRLTSRTTPGRGVLYGQSEGAREIQIRPSTQSSFGEPVAPPTIQQMPKHVEWLCGGGRRRGSSTFLDIGIGYDDLATSSCEIRDGRHLLVVGPSGSGRTTAIQTLTESWKRVRSGVVSIVSDGRFDEIPHVEGPHLVVVDDADHTRGGEQLLPRLHGAEDITVIASVDPLSLRMSFDHWTQQLRKSQTSILMTECASTDADLVHPGRLPTLPIEPRPGLAWVISGGATNLVQIAAMLGECQLSRIPLISSGSTTPLPSSPAPQLA